MENYQVLRVIGEGSFGRALLVSHLNAADKYVMKEIRLPKSSAAIKESRKEAILLAKMKHPNIVKFREAFEADDHLYIVMEYCDRGDLLETIKLQRGKLFPEHTVLHWFVQICLAIQHVHEKRVLHRDIKSKNIFLTQRRTIKLGDFGSARVLSSPMAYACTYVGTPYYVPPEIWENLPYNNKSDIWSLGCVLYEICTLKHPFQAGSWKNLIMKICHGTYSPLPSQYSYELRSLIKQIFRKDPRQRPSVNTILKRRGLLKMVNLCVSSQIDDTSGLPNDESTSMIQSMKEQQGASSDAQQSASPVADRKQWEKGATNTVLNVLEKAPILTSSIEANRSEGGHVIKYDLKEKRKEWNKEAPETLINILHNLDLCSAFKTYTIYRSKEDPKDCLKGPLFNNIQAPDATDGREEEIEMDPERLESRSDDEDTDFEEDEVDPDWVSELQKVTDSQ
ncbi:serine/threonine-protein kinase Nek3 [Bufo gargarizans]|uniref:serine/threonine-protein kinase Nek3 n=1 Tax=Bufo gargarizans TaxID=30331 RepID=UPI001CF2ED14|nr:serine/threonine-protein kinase Nek3 [Bufo gargarizans]XP_044143251.1 serine/threonine-protein kinase Nek3 [Bufo gargarizans]